jgi:hypothetical protein
MLPQSNGLTASQNRRVAANYLTNAVRLLEECAIGPSPEQPTRLRRVYWALKSAAVALEASEASWLPEHCPKRATDDALGWLIHAERTLDQGDIVRALDAARDARAAYPGRKHRTS